MKEITVETTGQFMIYDIGTGREIMPGKPATVPLTQFIRDRVEIGQLRVTDGELPPAEEPTGLEGTGGLHEALTGETPTELTGLAAALNGPDGSGTVDADHDGHDDNTGQFVEGNQEAADPPADNEAPTKPVTKRGGRRGS
jgi:hypothetical protein